ncbi:family 16 glycosylhydrolase [Flavobacterium sp. Fl-77]|uniref:Family 16 glycosylhydrolase n=1 Tax=Flavobacterium flavipigmentatum TaxID=2893884 RepID=A0AAJ2S838_9FLAO|nr:MULTISPECIES: family 16 glycosylhydrolase [unclassified Flavobacterium]MDX6181744.1 family 16 glycosylhydrolase [Flavobacterium sp. Fl-33]MDX6185222.1 family 16 glycosylhydrolase [Flavobacterium sp. Fl-77]UFH37328.1 family 16 glycosylhydrolase [Flavobacterium sp. F-70]
MSKKTIIKIISLFTILLMTGCQKDDYAFGDLSAPNNLKITAEIVGSTTAAPNGDGSGMVKLTATADNAISYKFVFSDGTSENSPSGIFTKRFTKTGVNTYTVTAIANGRGGVATNTTIDVTVVSDFSDDEAVQFLTGGSSKKWYWSASEPGHLGVGQNDGDATKNYYANYYQAAAWEKAAAPASSCLYENVLTFSLDGEQLKYQLDNGGSTFFNASFASVAGGSSPDDACLAYNTGGLKTVSLSPSESVVMANPNNATQTRGTTMNFSDGGFMGYYIGQSSYEILSITANRMVVRAVMGGNPALAWYHIFTTTKPTQNQAVDYTNLVFSDEFNTDGAPDATKWGFDTGRGDNGWGNGEKQNYTTANTNVIVQGGNLKITAKKEASGGADYSSARLKSENKFEFTYGKVEVRAKLPIGAGTWPAIWMLGENYATNTWPACGEIDIMEHVGNNQNVIHGTLHYPGNSGGNGNTGSKTIANVSTEFHVYKTIWSPASVKIYVDDELIHSVANSASLPFNKDFFLILNVAMGGSFGGNIDPAFTQSSMEIDYVRVYQ